MVHQSSGGAGSQVAGGGVPGRGQIWAARPGLCLASSQLRPVRLTSHQIWCGIGFSSHAVPRRHRHPRTTHARRVNARFFRSWSRKITRTTPSDRDKDICAEWPIWSAPVSTYDVTYPDRSVCLILVSVLRCFASVLSANCHGPLSASASPPARTGIQSCGSPDTRLFRARRQARSR